MNIIISNSIGEPIYEQIKKAIKQAIYSNELKEGGKVALLGFGSFSVSEKAARKGVNPKTKETIEIAARKAVKFKAGAELNELIK